MERRASSRSFVVGTFSCASCPRSVGNGICDTFHLTCAGIAASACVLSASPFKPLSQLCSWGLSSQSSPASGTAREDAQLSRLSSDAELPQDDRTLDVPSSSSSSESEKLNSELAVGSRLTCLKAGREA